MVYIPNIPAIKIPIIKAERKKAAELASLYSDSERADRFFHEYLASLTTLKYLRIQNIPATMKHRHLWEKSGNLTLYIVGLDVPKLRGYLRCFSDKSSHRTSLAKIDGSCAGYTITKLNERYTEGLLLGYARENYDDIFKPEELGSLDDLIDRLAESSLPRTLFS